ncbi:hypothetical protein E3P92_03765 [Wallemia ichthyophaga]|nr:hypothetical protein E3P92_03765 [Wallemia ichthyophaga]
MLGLVESKAGATASTPAPAPAPAPAQPQKFSFPASILNEGGVGVDVVEKQTQQPRPMPQPQPQQPQPQQPQQQPHIQHLQPPTPEQSKQPISRVTRACDRCTHKKLRCDGNIVPDLNGHPPTVTKACSRCVNAHVGCEYTRVQKRRGPSPGRKLSNESAGSGKSMHSPASSIDSQRDGHSLSQDSVKISTGGIPAVAASRVTSTNTSPPVHKPVHSPPPLKTIPTSSVSSFIGQQYTPVHGHINTHTHTHTQSQPPASSTPPAFRLPSISNWFEGTVQR